MLVPTRTAGVLLLKVGPTAVPPPCPKICARNLIRMIQVPSPSSNNARATNDKSLDHIPFYCTFFNSMPPGKKKRGEEKKKSKAFEALLHKAMVVDDNGREREAADKYYMEAVLAAPSVWKKHRYYAFGCYCDIIGDLLEEKVQIPRDEIKMLKRRFFSSTKKSLILTEHRPLL